MLAMILTSPPHSLQVSMSISNTRFNIEIEYCEKCGGERREHQDIGGNANPPCLHVLLPGVIRPCLTLVAVIIRVEYFNFLSLY